MTITHLKVSGLPNPADPAKVGGEDWDDAHVIAAGTITDVEVAAANKDGVAGTASMRTLGTGAVQAAAGDHTHAAYAPIASPTRCASSSSSGCRGPAAQYTHTAHSMSNSGCRCTPET